MSEPLPIVDGLTLEPSVRALLLPNEPCGEGRYPRWFYRIDSWEQARQTKLTAHFTLSELMSVDCREAPQLLREFPHYVPCAVSILARYLEVFRERAEAPVFIASNGGYRSPAHRFSAKPNAHSWATAADIYRVGDCWLDDEKSIERYARIAESIGQEVFTAPYGDQSHETDDHLHLDLGEVHWAPWR